MPSLSFSCIASRLIIFTTLFFVCACQQHATKIVPTVTNQTPTNSKAPTLKAIVDLGGLDIPLGGDIPHQMSDGRFSPGEWVMLKGKNIGVPFVTIDGIQVKVEKYFGDQPLIQIPIKLAPLKLHTLNLTTELGHASIEFSTSHYISATDTDGKKIYIIRTNPASKGGIEPEWLILDGAMARPMFAIMSPDSRFLFAVNIKQNAAAIYPGIKAFQLEMLTYHLANPNQPALVNTWSVDVGSTPVKAAINNSGNILLLGKQSFTLIDVKNPLHPQLIGSKKLPDNEGKTAFVDGVFLNGNQELAFLETYSNSIYVYKNDPSKQFPQERSLRLLPNKSIPLSVDLEVDPNNDNKFWVLEGPNYRLTGDSIEKLYQKVFKKPKPEDNERYISQIQQIERNDDALTVKTTFPLPDNYVSFSTQFGHNGLLYATLTKLDFINHQANADAGEGDTGTALLKKISNFLWDSISIGRVIAINTQTGKYETVASGVGIYDNVIDIPDIGPAFSLIKLGASLSFPYMTPSWGVGIKSTGTYTKRSMDAHAVFPPYSVGFVGFQY